MIHTTIYVNANGDDTESLATNVWNSTDHYLFMGRHDKGGLTKSYITLRFTELALPVGAVLVNAYLQVYKMATTTGVQYTTINFEDAVNPTAPTSDADLSSRPLGPTEYWEVPAAAGALTSGDLRAALYNVIGRGDWQSGSGLQLHWRNNGNANGNVGKFGAYDLGYGSAWLPRLDLYWVESSKFFMMFP